MRQIRTNRITRRRLGMTTAGIVAVGMLAVGGVACSTDTLPQAAVESTDATQSARAEGVACSDGALVTGEQMQKLIDEGLSAHATAAQQEALVKAVKSMVPAGTADTVSIEALKEAVANGDTLAAFADAKPATGDAVPRAC